MRKFISFILLFPFLASAGEEIEVKLETQSKLEPIYISQPYIPRSPFDWRYFDELRGVLQFDFDHNGFTRVADARNDWEERFVFPDVRAHFDPIAWRKDQIRYIVSLQAIENHLEIIVFDSQNKTSKKYADLPLTGKMEEDRVPIHRLADAIQKDLFGIEGVASLQIIYSNRQKIDNKWQSEIWVCDSDGHNARQITFEKGYCLSPYFLPKSISREKEFIYVSHTEGQSKIFRASMTKKTNKTESLISLRGNQALPAISKKGSHIAFITDTAGRPDLFIQNLDPTGRISGKARQLFSAPRATQASPTFSPDGKRVAFVSDKDGSPRIYLLDVLTPKDTKRATPRLITQKNRENTAPSWSPDGKKLAYSSKVDGIRQIWIYDFETQEELPLTTDLLSKENPSWAPDSLHLVYNTESEDVSELYLIHLLSKEPTLISKGSGQKRFASWEQ